jgi:hypothetical protein
MTRMILLKQSSINLVPLTLKERGSTTNLVLSNYIANNYINIGYFLGAQITADNYVLEVTSNELKQTKALLLKGVDNATQSQDRYDLWTLHLVDADDEDLNNYKITLNTGRYDYRVINDLDEVVESGQLKVVDEKSPIISVTTSGVGNDVPFVFK